MSSRPFSAMLSNAKTEAEMVLVVTQSRKSNLPTTASSRLRESRAGAASRAFREHHESLISAAAEHRSPGAEPEEGRTSFPAPAHPGAACVLFSRDLWACSDWCRGGPVFVIGGWPSSGQLSGTKTAPATLVPEVLFIDGSPPTCWDRSLVDAITVRPRMVRTVSGPLAAWARQRLAEDVTPMRKARLHIPASRRCHGS
ncbi:hypothetical protein BU26DRAFT_113372 [Trematosphaeria pertusa]|uniref:Uncharacterized protein n=1 Tax=Trematosphaeria pertusa TaxID=390896 RepID=A0A6A6HZS1_9PLEO|nr:uncharacterized protein BU26DRAFT_113372 [Trematosphaeria pertusa]KAF2243222.1 hypothetical protein BU26DRAFT_113372 [Trematosphaeria pertusa]